MTSAERTRLIRSTHLEILKADSNKTGLNPGLVCGIILRASYGTRQQPLMPSQATMQLAAI
jgi:hypothetical protein